MKISAFPKCYLEEISSDGGMTVFVQGIDRLQVVFDGGGQRGESMTDNGKRSAA